MEFAIIAPVLFLITFGIVEIGLMMATLTTIEGGLKQASRYGITGQTPSDATRQEKIRAILEQHTIGLVDFSEATFTVKTYPSFSGVGQPEPFVDSAPGDPDDPNPCHNDRYDDPSTGCFETFTDLDADGTWDEDIGEDGAGMGGEVVSYTVDIPWRIMTPVFDRLFGEGEDRVLPLHATIVVRNEPNLYQE